MKSKIIGKTKEQVLKHLGDDYDTDFGGDVWIYTLRKTWFSRGTALIIEFDYDGVAISVDKV